MSILNLRIHFFTCFNTCFFFLLQEHFYDPLSHTGFLEMRLRNVRRNLEEGQRRYHKRKFGCNSASAQPSTVQPSTVQPLRDEDLSEWMSIIKRMKPSSENMTPIKTAMEKTFSHRRNWISTKSPTVADIVQQYPRFIDIPSLVSLFFIDMYLFFPRSLLFI